MPEISPEPEMNTRDLYKQQMLEDTEVRRSREEWVADREAELRKMQEALAQQLPKGEAARPVAAAGSSRPAAREREARAGPRKPSVRGARGPEPRGWRAGRLGRGPPSTTGR